MNAKPTRPMCGAKTRGGKPCKRSPVPGKSRCRLHGGLSTGPKNAARPGNRNAQRHGIYSRRLTDEERALFPREPVGLIEEELMIARVQLRRAWIAEKRQEEELARYKSSRGRYTFGDRTSWRRINFFQHFFVLIGRIADLEMLKAELIELHRSRVSDTPVPPAVPVTYVFPVNEKE